MAGHARTARRWRRRLADTLFGLTISLAMVMGVLPLRYFARRQRVQESRAVTAWSICFNVAVLAMVGVVLPMLADAAEVEFFNKKRLNALINAVQTTLTISTVVVTVYRNWTGRTHYMHIFSNLFALHRASAQQPQQQCGTATFDYFVIGKSLANLLQILCNLESMYALRFKADLRFVLMVMLATILQHILLLIETLHLLALLLLYRHFCAINEQLRQIASKIRARHSADSAAGQPHGLWMQHCADLADAVDTLMATYGRLLGISDRTMCLFQWQTFMQLLSTAVENVVNVFYLCVYLGGKVIATSGPHFMLLFPLRVAINLVDFWISISVCQVLERAAHHTSALLREFNGFALPDARLGQSLDSFALLCSTQPLRLQLCGFFALNYRLCFEVFVGTLLHIVVLVQFDYMNL